MKRMKSTSRKTLLMLLIFLLAFMSLKGKVVYAATEAEELRGLLDEYEEELGDLNQLKKVIDETYNDLYTATQVDDALKEKLNSDIDKFNEIDGINPLIKSVLDMELRSQVKNLTDENIDEMREEILVIKEWVDAKVGSSENNANNGNNENNSEEVVTDEKDDPVDKIEQTSTNEVIVDKTVSNQSLPKAGAKGIISISLILLIIGAIILRIKNIQLKEIK